MRTHRMSSFLTVIMIATQVLGPATVWAVESQRGVRLEGTHGLMTGFSEGGSAQVVTVESAPRTLRFLDRIASGEQITVNSGTVAEILWQTRALITVTGPAQLRVSQETPAQTLVKLYGGTLRLATAASALGPEETVLLETPTTKVRTHGGVLRSTVAPTPEGSSPAYGSSAAHVIPVSVAEPNLFAASSGLSETLHVDEGRAELIANAPGSAPVMLERGESVRVLAGQVEAPGPSVPTATEQNRPLTLAVARHAKTPASGTDHMVTQQRAQAQALQQAMLGTTDFEGVTAGESGTKNSILATTQGVNLPGGSQPMLNLPRLGFGAPGEVGGPVAGLTDPISDEGFIIEAGSASNIPKPKGGGGLLLFDRSLVTLDGSKNNGNRIINLGYTPINTELFLVDGGGSANGSRNAPHRGQVPNERLTISGLVGSDASGENVTPGQPGRNLFVPFPGPAADFGVSGEPVVFTRLIPPPERPQRESDFNRQLLNILETFASRPEVVPGGELSGTNNEVFARNVIIFQGNTLSHAAGVNGGIRARSIESQSVTAAGGIVLNNSTHLIAPPTAAASTYFTQAGDINSSVAAVIGRNFDLSIEDRNSDSIPDFIAIQGGSLNPAKVVLEDRALAVLDGSSIIPAPGARVSLLSILDSQLTGPGGPPRLLPGDIQPAGTRTGFARSDTDVPALIEVIGSNGMTPGSPSIEGKTTSRSAIVVRATDVGGTNQIDKALLIASAPLISIIQGQMTTTTTNGHFVSIEGNGTPGSARLAANIPNDQILLAGIQLNKSVLDVGGHLFNVTGGATASVTGNLVALSEDSTLKLAGALVNVGQHSSFTLRGGSLIAFGFGTNTVNVMPGNPNSCDGCTPRAIPNLAGIPVLAHPTATLDIHPEFVPIAGAGVGTVAVGGASRSFSNTVKNESGAPLIQVGLGGRLTLGR